MALRVLLADESVHIKQALQLVFQDYAAIVQSVNVGLDVGPVAKKFKPDIVFADVLLQKKNGYEVCAELKKDSETKDIPVVLMWSGFMELDRDKFEACGANAEIEKPFDDLGLRRVVQNLVPKTKTQGLSQFLNFPKMPEWQEVQRPSTAQQMPPPAPVQTEDEKQLWTMENFKPIENFDSSHEEGFKAVELATERPEGDLLTHPEINVLSDIPEDAEKDAAWKEASLKKFQLGIDPDSISSEAESTALVDSAMEEHTTIDSQFEKTEVGPPPKGDITGESELEVEDFSSLGTDEDAPLPLSPSPLTASQVEEIVRSQSREIIEEAVWKIIPELAEQIIERELQKLLAERDAR